MKKTLITIALIMIIPAMLSAGQLHTTKSSYPFAITKPIFEKLSEMLRQKDYAAADKFINAGIAGIFKGGDKVYVIDRTWTGLVEIRPVGGTGTVWTVREALVE